MPSDGSGADQVLTFAAGGRALAIASADVAEVVVSPRVTRVPQAPPGLQGLANLRSKVVPILSVDALLGGDGAAPGGRVIVLNGQDPVGLAVDRIGAMRTVERRGHDEATSAELIQTEDGAARLLRLEPLLAGVLSGLRQRSSTRGPKAAPEAEAPPQTADVAFLQFQLAGQAYALPLEQVREVTPVPAELTTLPKTDAVMLGVAPLRGDLLALVSLRALLGLPPAELAAARVVVATLGSATIGLVVDSVRAILRTREQDIGAVPSLLNRGAGEARIDAIVRTPDGLVSVLATERIFLEETVAAMLAEGAGRRDDDARIETGDTAVEQFVLFRLADETYGLPIHAVSEVVRLPETVSRVPRAPAFVAGIMNHRGAVVPLIDQRRRFGVTGDDARQSRVIVTQIDELTAGFIVDQVERILDVPADALRPAPDLATGDAQVFDRIATLDVDGRLVLLVDPRQLLDQAERDIVRDLARRSETETA